MQGIIRLQREQSVGIDGHVHVGSLQGHLHIGEADIFEGMDGIQSRFTQGFRRRISVLRQQFPLQRATVHPDPQRNVPLTHCLHDFLDLPPSADVAGVDPDAIHDLRRFERQPVIEMNVGDQRDRDLGSDGRERRGGFRRIHRDANNLAADLLKFVDLSDRGLYVGSVGRRHGLDDDRRAATDRHPPHANLFRLAPCNEHAIVWLARPAQPSPVIPLPLRRSPLLLAHSAPGEDPAAPARRIYPEDPGLGSVS